MSNFMGPMAPPQAAPQTPQSLDFQTDPNQRQKFRQFMRQRMQPPMPMYQPMPTVPVGSYIIPDIDVFAPQPMGFAVGGSVDDALAAALSDDIGDYAVDDTKTDLSQTDWSGDDQNRVDYGDSEKSALSQQIGQQINEAIQSSQLNAMPSPVPYSSVSPNQMGINQEIGSQLNASTSIPAGIAGISMPSLAGKSVTMDLLGNPITIGFEGGGDVPPRSANIRGQYHELSYITPDEADILMALGGSGEAGPMGIPQYSYGDGDFGQDDPESDATAGAGPSGGNNEDTSEGNEGDDPVGPSNVGGLFDSDEREEAAFSEAITGIKHEGDDSDGSFADMVAAEKVNAALDRALANTQAARNQAAINNAMSSPEMMRERTQLQAGLDGIRTRTQEQQNQANSIQQGFFETDLMDELGIGAVSTGRTGTRSRNDVLGDLLNTFTEAVKNKTAAPSVTVPDANQIRQAIETRNNMIENEVQTGQRSPAAPAGPSSTTIFGMEDEREDKNYVGGAPVGQRFGQATGPNRLSTLTPDEIESLRTGNIMQRQMYNALPNYIKGADAPPAEKGMFDSLLGNLQKPGSAIEVFRNPQTGKVAGMTSVANMPGILGGIMSMFGGEPVVYTGDNRFDPNFVEDVGSDDVILPLKPEEVSPEVTDPNMIGGVDGGQATVPAASSVVVPSTRASTPFNAIMPVGYGTPQTGAINPYSLAEMQRYQQMLAQMGQGSPIPFAEGGSVLDAAAGKFLEALTAA